MKNFVNSLTLILVLLFSTQFLQAAVVDGQVLYQDNPDRPVNNVMVVLRNLDNNELQTYTTGGNGYYVFNDVPNGNYILTGTTALPGGGVTLLDAFLVFLHLNRMYPFTPMQTLAADVNGSGNVTWGDYILILNHIRKGHPFPVGPWTFEISTFTISNFKDGVPNGLGGTCSGDVGGTFVPTVNNTPALPVAQEGSINVTNEEPFSTRILTQNDFTITGAGLIINYPSDLITIESVEFKGTDYEYTIDGGQVRLIWGDPNTAPIHFGTGETLITLHGISTPAFTQGITASLSLDGNTSLINPDNQEITNLKFASPVIKYGNPSLKLSNYPNPFTSSTRLNIYTPEAGNASVEIFSASGQMVKNISLGNMDAGSHEVDLDGSQLAKGYYVCRLHVQTSNGDLSNTIRILKAE
jgi:hypothetical protein